MSINPPVLPPGWGPAPNGRSAHSLLAPLYDYAEVTDARLDDLESRSGTSGPGLMPDPDYPGYYVISEGGDPGAPVDYPPTITLGVSATSLDATATFTASDPEGAPVAVNIDWGDGSTTTLATSPATHTYATNGTYTVTATATAGGKTGTDSVEVTVALIVTTGAFSAAVIDSAPAFYFPFAEETKPFADAVGSATLTVQDGMGEPVAGGPSLGTLPRASSWNLGGGGPALGYTVGGSPLPATLSTWTFEMVLELDSVYFDRDLLNIYNNSSDREFRIRLVGSGSTTSPTAPRITFYSGSSLRLEAQGANSVDNTRPHHLVFTYDGTNLVIYRNGTVDTTTAASPAEVALDLSAIPLRLGARPGFTVGNDSFRGLLGGVAAYDRALTPTEVADHFSALGIGA